MKAFQFNIIPLKITKTGTKAFVFDPLRKKNILLTPEEEVRQKLLWYFIYEKKLAPGLIAIERGLKINGLIKRFDIVIYNSSGTPYLAIECKAPSVKLSQAALQQLATYNIHLKAELLMISNGMEHILSHVNFETKEITFLEKLPF